MVHGRGFRETKYDLSMRAPNSINNQKCFKGVDDLRALSLLGSAPQVSSTSQIHLREIWSQIWHWIVLAFVRAWKWFSNLIGVETLLISTGF